MKDLLLCFMVAPVAIYFTALDEDIITQVIIGLWAMLMARIVIYILRDSGV